MARDFRNIKAWQYSDDLTVLVYAKTRSFPKEELYGITSQLRRAAVSVAANISEGSARKHKKDYLHFLYIARGSLAETDYLLHLSKRIEYLKENDYLKLEDMRATTARTLYGLITSVEKEIEPARS